MLKKQKLLMGGREENNINNSNFFKKCLYSIQHFRLLSN